MTPFKNYSRNIPWTNRIRRGSLYVAVAAMMGMQMSCGDSGSNSSSENDWEQVTVKEPTKGVVTTLEETASGEYQILNEQVVAAKDSSRVVIKHLDGKTETLTVAQAKGLVHPTDTVPRPNQNPPNNVVVVHHGSGLGHVLWWGAMGYMMGRSFGSPVQPYIYRDDRSRFHNGATFGGYSSGTRAAEEISRTSVSRTEMRPVSGRSGFFRGSRGSSGKG
jgi:hypothetical protein